MTARNENGFVERSVLCASPSGLHRMAYTQWGERDNPRVVLCVHGLSRNGRDFDDLARALAPRLSMVRGEPVFDKTSSDQLHVIFHSHAG